MHWQPEPDLTPAVLISALNPSQHMPAVSSQDSLRHCIHHEETPVYLPIKADMIASVFRSAMCLFGIC